jgi:polar amino acid transport system substrate-binding protein
MFSQFKCAGLYLFLSVAFIISRVAFSKDNVQIYAYHLKPPYMIDVEQEIGFYFDLISLINKHQQVANFKLDFLPRNRLNRDIAEAKLDGLIMGANPLWFHDVERKKFVWSRPFMFDQDEFVSHTKAPFEFIDDKSLHEKVIGGVRGHFYFHVDPVVGAKKATLIATGSDHQLLELIVKQRIDVAVISRATVNYLVSENKTWKNEIYFSKLPHERYERAFLAPHALQSRIATIDSLLQMPKFKDELQHLLKRYHVTDEEILADY